jgi:hypothetical protein
MLPRRKRFVVFSVSVLLDGSIPSLAEALFSSVMVPRESDISLAGPVE